MSTPTTTSTPSLDALALQVAAALRDIGQELSSLYYERRSVIEMIILSVLSKQHGYVLGLPGTAKSELIRAFFERIIGAVYYEQLLSKNRPDQAVLGPYDLPLLRDKGEFKRKINGFLLTADFAMLDEIGKMSPTLGHDLLAALNERIRHEVNGSHSVHKIPLRTVISASNELIVQESEDAAALWDRLLLRWQVDFLSEPGNFAALLAGAVVNPAAKAQVKHTTIQFADIVRVTDEFVPQVVMPNDVIDACMNLRAELFGDGIRVSDRRWRQSVRVMQAAATLAGREAVTLDDMSALRFVLWDIPSQRTQIERKVLKIANPLNEKCLGYMDSVKEWQDGVLSRKGKALKERAGYGTETLGKLKTVEGELSKLAEECRRNGRSTAKVDEVADSVKGLRRLVYVECLDITDAPGV